MRRLISAALLILTSSNAYSQMIHECDTSRSSLDSMRRQWRETSRLVPATELQALPEVTASHGVILVPNDDTITPNLRPFNLKGKSVTFTRTGAESFRSATGPLQYDDEIGSKLALDPTTLSATYTIEGFEFPFFDTTRRTLHISRLLAIFFDAPPPPATFRQYTDADLALLRVPMIAPLLTTIPSQTSFRTPSVYVKETSDSVVVTWDEPNRPVKIQAVLFRNGDVRLSYGSIGNVRGGALHITSGTEPWRTPALIGETSDGTNDFTTSNPPEIAAMMDMTHASVSRLGATNIVQFVVRTRSPIDRAILGPDRSLGLNIQLGSGAFISAQIRGNGPSGDQLSTALFAVTGVTPLLTVEGDTITVTLAQESALRNAPSDQPLNISLANERGGDTAAIDARIDLPEVPFRTDFGALTSVDVLEGPISDAFTVTSSNVFAAWERVRSAFDLDPAQIDGVAVFQNFQTLGVPVASVGNAGVDHISIGTSISSELPREPNIFDMHTIRELWNSNDVSVGAIMLHEWGHRWMFFIEHMENGVASHALNSGGHPALNVDTRAAFPVHHPFDCSVMGGATWSDDGDGSFTGPEDTCGNSYSWLDLYLMGLASPEEVPPFFYLTDADPPMDEVPFIEGQTFRATRRNVTIQDVVARMGLRNPLYPDTQRTFKVLVALVYDPAQPLPVEDVEVVAHYADVFRQQFSTATGGRASVDTSFPTLERRRPARR